MELILSSSFVKRFIKTSIGVGLSELICNGMNCLTVG